MSKKPQTINWEPYVRYFYEVIVYNPEIGLSARSDASRDDLRFNGTKFLTKHSSVTFDLQIVRINMSHTLVLNRFDLQATFTHSDTQKFLDSKKFLEHWGLVAPKFPFPYNDSLKACYWELPRAQNLQVLLEKYDELALKFKLPTFFS
jgi:hypothetical protein